MVKTILPLCLCCDGIIDRDLCSTDCGHFYHGACIRNYLNKKRRCLQCNELTDINKLRIHYVDTSIDPGTVKPFVIEPADYHEVKAVHAKVGKIHHKLDQRVKSFDYDHGQNDSDIWYYKYEIAEKKKEVEKLDKGAVLQYNMLKHLEEEKKKYTEKIKIVTEMLQKIHRDSGVASCPE